MKTLAEWSVEVDKNQRKYDEERKSGLRCQQFGFHQGSGSYCKLCGAFGPWNPPKRIENES